MSGESVKTPASSQRATKTAASISNSSIAPLVVPINKDAKTFFNLPSETRDQIYGELRPETPDFAIMLWRDTLRSDGQKTSTIFISTCRAVDKEAASVLYDFFPARQKGISASVSIMTGRSLFFAVALNYLGEVLAMKLPPADTDTSSFCYVIADEELLEWQTQGRAAEKEGKAKRKREKELARDGKGRKKERMSEQN